MKDQVNMFTNYHKRDEELKRLTEKRDCEIKLLSDRVLTLEESNKNRRTK